MSGVACVTPIKNPTPSAMIAMMAMNRPKLVLNSLAMFLLNFLILLPSAPLENPAPEPPRASPLDGRNVGGMLVQLFRRHAPVFDVDHPVRHLRDGLVVRDDDDRFFAIFADILQQF